LLSTPSYFRIDNLSGFDYNMLCYSTKRHPIWKEAKIKMTDKDLAGKVRRMRKAMGLTQEQFAAKIGVTVSTVNRWEKGRSKPQPFIQKVLRQLAEEHDVK